MPTTIQVEARSLAALNDLASNPPQYPRNPAHGRQEPLTLYISRVPGTKDVILSTFRPGLKNVTAEDIASSLYYVHHELPAPVSIPQQRPRQLSDTQNHPRPSFESTMADSTQKHIRRKPVPSSGGASPVMPEPSSPAHTPIPSPSPSSQLDVHPLLRTPLPEQQSPSQNLAPSPSFSPYRPGGSAGLPSPPPTLYPNGGLSPTRTQYDNTGLSPARLVTDLGRGAHANDSLSPSRYNDNALHLQGGGNLSPSRAGEGSFRAYSPLHSTSASPQPSGGSSPAMSLDRPMVRTPSPPKPTRTQSKASEHPALPSSRRALASTPASPSAEADQAPYSLVFQALDEFEPAPPVPPKHPRRLSEHNILDGLGKMPANRPMTPAETPTQPRAMSPPPAYSPARPSAQPTTFRQEMRPSMEMPLDARNNSGGPKLMAANGGNHRVESGRRSLDTRLGLLTPPTVVDRSPSPHKQHHAPAPTTPGHFTLTLIRREPSSGHQWNVGRITALASPRHGDSDHDHQDAAPPLLHIHVDTLGYAKFTNPISYRQYAGMDPRQAMSTSVAPEPQNGQRSTSPSNGAMTPLAQETPRFAGPAAFQREVRAAYGKRWRSNIKGFFRRSHHAGVPSLGMHGRRNSDDSTGSLDGDGHPHSSRDTKLRGYEFESPWGGRCEFRTAEGGRNLRCQHHLPLEGVAPIPGQEASTQMSRDPISELRFNLPRQHHLRSKSSSDVPTEQSLTGHFSRLLQQREDEEEEWDDGDGLGMVSPFELNLGREKAGGGHHGKRAKMGKLIVYDAGLKMLDLVVATNVGLWWRLWDVQG